MQRLTGFSFSIVLHGRDNHGSLVLAFPEWVCPTLSLPALAKVMDETAVTNAALSSTSGIITVCIDPLTRLLTFQDGHQARDTWENGLLFGKYLRNNLTLMHWERRSAGARAESGIHGEPPKIDRLSESYGFSNRRPLYYPINSSPFICHNWP